MAWNYQIAVTLTLPNRDVLKIYSFDTRFIQKLVAKSV